MNRAMGLCGLAAALFCLCGAGRAETYVVSQGDGKASDENAGTAGAPLKTLAKGVSLLKPGDTLLVKAGRYAETLTIAASGAEGKPIVVQGAPGEETLVLGGMDITDAAFVQVRGLKFTSGGETMKGRKAFLVVRGATDSEVADCEIYEKAENEDWYYRGIDIYGCTRFTFRNSRIHHIDIGVNLGSDKDCVMDGLEIGPWDHEDGMRLMRCDGILVQNCHIQSEEVYKPGATHGHRGHIDGIQIIRKNDRLTIRNNYIHGTAQGIGCFTDSFGQVEGWNEPRKNLRIEGNLILTFNKWQGISMYRVENPVVVNNTLPQSRIEVGSATGGQGVVKNNIAVIGSVSTNITEVDCNIWTEERKGGTKVGEHDLFQVSPRFVNAPAFDEASNYKVVDQYTERRLVLGDPAEGRIAVGDMVELGGDGVLRKVTAVEGKWFEFDPPLPAKPTGSMRVANWKTGTKSFVRDFHLRPDSPAIDSADSSVGRGKDRDGHETVDDPAVPNTGVGPVPYLDRGALEYIPAK